MKKYILVLIAFLTTSAWGQNDFSTQIQRIADTISKKIVQTGNKKVAVTEFINLDESTTRLGQFLSDELSSDLSNLTENLTRFEVIERTNLDIIFKEKKLIQSVDRSRMAKDLGKLDVADILIWAIISDFEGYYRVNIKLLDTKSGSALGAYKTQFIKSPTLESYNKQIIKKSETESNNNTDEQSKDTKRESRIVTPVATSPSILPCEQKQVGTLRITHKFITDNWVASTKIVVRIPKSPNNAKDYRYIILERQEYKDLSDLKEGVYEYEARQFDANERNGFGPYFLVSSGQIEIIKCKPSSIEIH